MDDPWIPTDRSGIVSFRVTSITKRSIVDLYYLRSFASFEHWIELASFSKFFKNQDYYYHFDIEIFQRISLVNKMQK